MKRYSIGFDNGDWWNGICGVCGFRNAQKLAAEIAVEYGEMPEIREVIPEPENPLKYVVMGIWRDNGGYGEYHRSGDRCILAHAETRKEAAEQKADFQRTRGVEFTRIWIEKTA